MTGAKTLLVFFIAFAVTDYGTCFTLKNNETSKRETIIGGSRTSIETSPYFVQVTASRKFCGGTLITLQHVLTARHCIEHVIGNPSKINILGGSDTSLAFKEKRKGKRLFAPPGSTNSENDIVIILVDEPFMSGRVKHVKIAPNRPNMGEIVIIIAMGSPSRSAKHLSQHLQLLAGYVAPCIKPNTKDLCVSNPTNAGICLGDSGSPLINAQGELVAVASRCTQGYALGYPDSYISVHEHLSFILTVISVGL